MITRERYVWPPWRRSPGLASRLSKDKTDWEVVTFKRPEKPKNGHGTIDYKKRLWQHSSTERGISGTTWHGDFVYAYDDEWPLIEKYADWIEFQDRTCRPVVFYRISVYVAQRAGRIVQTPNGPRWAVPLDYYAVSERSLE